MKKPTPWRDFLLPDEKLELNYMLAKVRDLKKETNALRVKILMIRDRGYSRAKRGENGRIMKRHREENGI